MMRIVKKDLNLIAVLLLIFQLFWPFSQVKATDQQVSEQLFFMQDDKALSGKDVKDKLEVKTGDATVLSLKRKQADQDLDAKVVLPELFAYEKDQTVKANQVLLAMGGEEEKKLDPAGEIEEKEEDGTKFLLFHFKAGQDEIKLALKGVKTGTGQLLATFKDCEQDYVSYPVSAVVGDAEAASEASKEKAAEEQSSSAQSAKADEKAEAEQKTEAALKTESKENAASTQSSTAEAKSEKTEKAASSSEENKTSADEKQASASSTSSEAKKAADAKATADTTRSAASPKLPFTARMLKSQLSAAQTAVTSDANVDLAISSDELGQGKIRQFSAVCC